MAGILAAGVAPAVLPSGIIMPIRKLWTPPTVSGMSLLMDNDIILVDGEYYKIFTTILSGVSNHVEVL